MLSLPASSAEAERAFSLMKIIKTDWRSRLTDDSVSDLMTIKFDSPDVKDFGPQPAIDVWLLKKRMPYFRDNRIRLRREEDDRPAEDMDGIVGKQIYFGFIVTHNFLII